MMADHFARICGSGPLVVLSPDVGGVKRAQLFRELLEGRLGRPVELAFVEKRRALDVVSGGTLVGMTGNQQTVIVLDDSLSMSAGSPGAEAPGATSPRAQALGAIHSIVARGNHDPVHVVFAGIEKLVPTFDDAMTQLRLLGRSGTAQRITSYSTFITGPTPGH